VWFPSFWQISAFPSFHVRNNTGSLAYRLRATRLLTSDWKQCQISEATYAETQNWGASCNRCWRGKAIGITYSECVPVACYPARKAHAPCYVVICRLPGCTASHSRHFRTGVTEHKMCMFIFSTTFVWNISHSKNKCRHNNNKLQLGCHPVAVVILHVYKIWNWLLLNLSREGYMTSM